MNNVGEDFKICKKTAKRKTRSVEKILSKISDVPTDEEVYKSYPNAQIIYILNHRIVIHDRTNESQRNQGKETLDRYFRSITWITYRACLEISLLNTTYRSDSGWGCMLRTG